MASEQYISPFSGRYASKEMQSLFSERHKVILWRRLWIALAESEKELGLGITDEQIAELKAHAEDLNLEEAHEREKAVRHDVMSQIYAYGLQCPHAKGILHLGATSCYVTDNADILILRDALGLLEKKLVNILDRLSAEALKYKDLPCLGYTHFQGAQPVTVGKRMALWLQDFLYDYREVGHAQEVLRPRGAKGTTGTQASYLELFDGDREKVEKLDRLIAQKMGFARPVSLSGQTYTRKIDSIVLNAVKGIGETSMKMGNDLRLLQHEQEIEEPFAAEQVGSSAMAYKRNPMHAERICGLSRYLINECGSASYTAGTQWLERTLDDSSSRRISNAECFLCADGILDLDLYVISGWTVYPKMIERNLMEEMPFLATENILMDAVRGGADRQEAHERIRRLSMAASGHVKEGKKNDLADLIAQDPVLSLSGKQIEESMNPAKYTGCAGEQVEKFVEEEIRPVLEEKKSLLGYRADIRV